MDKSLILNEIKKYKKFRTDKEFADYIGISPQGLSKWYERNFYDIDKLSTTFPEISAEWLLRGEGNMLKTTSSPYPTDIISTNTVAEQTKPYNIDKGVKIAPLIPVDVTRQPNIRIWDFVQRHKDLYDTIPDRLMPNFDLIHTVRSNALSPAIEKGDTLFLQHLELSTDSIVNGHIYFIDTKKNGIVIKRVFINDNHLQCFSLSNNVPVKTFSIDDIYDLFSIVAILKFSIYSNELLDNQNQMFSKLIDTNRDVITQNSALIEELSAQRRIVEHLITGR